MVDARKGVKRWWGLLLVPAVLVSGCVSAPPVARPPVSSPATLACEDLRELLAYERKLQAMDEGRLQQEAARLRATGVSGVRGDLVRLRRAALARGGAGMPDADDNAVFAALVRDAALVVKKSATEVAAAHNALFAARNKIKKLEQSLHDSQQRADALAVQIRELQEIEKIIRERREQR